MDSTNRKDNMFTCLTWNAAADSVLISGVRPINRLISPIRLELIFDHINRFWTDNILQKKVTGSRFNIHPIYDDLLYRWDSLATVVSLQLDFYTDKCKRLKTFQYESIPFFFSFKCLYIVSCQNFCKDSVDKMQHTYIGLLIKTVKQQSIFDNGQVSDKRRAIV